MIDYSTHMLVVEPCKKAETDMECSSIPQRLIGAKQTMLRKRKYGLQIRRRLVWIEPEKLCWYLIESRDPDRSKMLGFELQGLAFSHEA